MKSLVCIVNLSTFEDPRDNYSAIFDGIDSHYMKLGEDSKKSLASFINRARMDLKSCIFS